jgi:hypothetical protein
LEDYSPKSGARNLLLTIPRLNTGMFAPALMLALLLATGLVTGLGLGIRAEPGTTGAQSGRGLV